MNRDPIHIRLVGWFQEYVVMTTGVLVVGPTVGLLKWLRRVLMALAGVGMVLLEPIHGIGLVLLRVFKIRALQALCWIFEKHYARLFRALSNFDRS